MCRKLIVLLLVVALSVSAKAVYIGFDQDDMPNGCANPLKVDIDGGGTTSVMCSDNNPWQHWLFARDWTGPAIQTMNNKWADYAFENPVVQLEVYRKAGEVDQGGTGATNVGMSRDRCGGWTGVGVTGDYSAGTRGYGMNYVKLTITQVKPSTQYKMFAWGCEDTGVWAMRTDNPQSKWAAISTTNPKAWLDAHAGQYNGIGSGALDPNGYGPKFSVDNPIATTDTNMPGSANNPYTGVGPSLYDLTVACGAEGGRWNLNRPGDGNPTGDMLNGDTFYLMSNDLGQIVVYAWIDATDWGGSAHLPLCDFMLVPEPATIALLGLGGLALIRRKRA